MRKKKSFLFLITICLWGLSLKTYAQLTGTRTIGTSGNYTTFAAAITDLNTQGVGTGGVIFEFIDNSGGNFTETISASQIITTTTGTSANQITFRPASSIGTATLTATTAIIPIDLNGADYVNFDGRNGGTGTNKNLIFVNTNTANAVLQLRNGATNNQIRYTKIQSRNTGTTSGAIVFSTSTGGANTNNLIDNCEISGDGTGFPANGIYSSGSASPNNNTNNTVSNCFIYDYFVAGSATNGIFLSSNTTDWTITNNRFYQTASRTYTTAQTHRAIQIGTGNGYTITDNIIGYANSVGTGTYTMAGSVATIFTPIEVTLGTITTSNIRGNKIKNINFSTTSGSTTGVFRGIVINGGTVNVGGTGAGEGNEIGDDASNGNISVTSTTGGAAIFIGGIVNVGTTNNVNIQGNKIGSITGVGTASVTYSIVGIQTGGFGNITNNVVGSVTQSNSLYNNTAASASTAILMYGVFVSGYTGASNILIDQNIIANLNTTHTGNNTSALTRGIYTTGSMTGNLTITNNQVFNISTSSINNGSSYNTAVLGGIICNSAALVTITGNQVYNLRQLGGNASVQLFGIYPNIANVVANTVSRNLIYDLSSTSTGTAAIYGLRMAGSGANICANNVIRLGQGITLAHPIYGLYDLLGASNYYYNTVYISGTIASGSARSFALANDATNTRTIQNNIFVNVRDNATTGINKHFAYLSGTTGTLTSDYNIVFANGVDGVPFGRGSSTGTITSYTNYRNYRIAYPTLEVNSAVGNPQLNNPPAVIPDMSLALLSPAFQTGTPIGSVTNDYANLTRNAITPNIGAYETVSSSANATTDIFTPVITYTLLSTPYAIATGTRILTATIKDNGTGIPTSGGNVPRLYYRNLSAGGAWSSVVGTLTSGNGSNGTWDFVLDQTPLSLVAGQTIAYYVVAQDQATTPNIWYNAFDAVLAHSNVNTQSAQPTTPNTYIISGAMGGVYNIPNQFTSLTKAGGFFNALNNATSITSNITVNITANLDEDGLNDLSTWIDGGANYTLTIQPDATTLRTIQNSANILPNNTDMIRINTAVGVMIDGGTGKNLFFRNTNSTANNTGSTISFANTVSKLCTVQNATIENNTNNATEGNIAILGGTNSVNINNCNIGDATAGGVATGSTRKGVYEATGILNVVDIQNNNIYNFLDNGVSLNSCANGAVVSGNKFYYNFVGGFPNGTDVIYVNANSGHTISNNVIGGANNTNTGTWDFNVTGLFRGIFLSGTTTTLNNIQGNTIKNINPSFNSTSTFQGVVIVGSSRVLIDALTIDNIQMTTANTGSVVFDGVSLGGNSSSITNSTFNNMVSGAGHTGFMRIINITNALNYTISGCTISNITSRGASSGQFYAIGNANGANVTITNNIIRDISILNTGDFRAYYQTTGSAVSTITRNRIYNITSSSGALYGIYAFNGDITTAYNQISITNGAGINPLTIVGIYENTATGKVGNHYFNTIYIGGSQNTGGVNSFCYQRASNNSTVNIRNNILINARTSTGGTGKHYAIGANSTTTWASNYNLLVKGATASNFIGLTNTTDRSTFALWQTNQTNQDINSWSAPTGATSDFQTLNPNNLFVDLANGNLNINTANQELWFVNGKGTQIAGFADDFGATAVRSVAVNTGGTDLGSDEINANTGVAPILANVTGSFANNGTVTFTFAGRQIGSLTWGATGTVPTGLNVWYYSGSRPLYPNTTAQFFNGYWRVENVGVMGTTYNMTLNYDNALIGTIGALANTKMSKRESGVTPPSNAENNWVTEQTNSAINVPANTLSSTSFIYNNFSEFTGSQDVAALPLQLLSFEAKRKNNQEVSLQWATTNEIDLEYFVIEKSQNGQVFSEIARTDATNKSTQIKNYAAIDTENQSAYYRLRFLHHNSPDEYSMIRFVEGGNEQEKIYVYPNPLFENVNFEIPTYLKENKNIVVKIIDTQNKILGEYTGNWKSITTQITQAHKNWASGVYIWQIIPQGEKMQIIKVVK